MNRYCDLWLNPSHNPKNKSLAHLRFHTAGKGYLYVEGVGFSGFSLMLEPNQHRDFETLMENIMLPLRAFWDAYEKHINAVEGARLQLREVVDECEKEWQRRGIKLNPTLAKARGEPSR